MISTSPRPAGTTMPSSTCEKSVPPWPEAMVPPTRAARRAICVVPRVTLVVSVAP